MRHGKFILLVSVYLIISFQFVYSQVNLPIEKYKLKNGVQVIFIEYGLLPVTSFNVFIDVGKENETPGLQSITDITSNAIMMGNNKWNRIDQDNLLNAMGTNIYAGSNDNYTQVSTQFLNQDVDIGVELLAAIITQPVFPNKEIKQKINELIDFNTTSRMEITSIADKFSDYVVFGIAHPLGRNFYPKQLNAIDSAKIKEYYLFNYTPKNINIIVCGKFEKEKLKLLLEKYFGKWNAEYGEMNSVSYDFEPIKRKEIFFVNRDNAKQSALQWNKTAPSADSKEILPLKLAFSAFNTIMMNQIRAKEGLTYGIYTRFNEKDNNRVFSIGTQTRSEKTLNMIESFDIVLNDFFNNGITEVQLDNAKQFSKNGVLGMETPSVIAEFFNPLIYRDLEKRKKIVADIENMDLETVNKVIKKYFSPDVYKLVIVGNENDVSEQLSKIPNLRKLPINSIEIDN